MPKKGLAKVPESDTAKMAKSAAPFKPPPAPAVVMRQEDKPAPPKPPPAPSGGKKGCKGSTRRR